jgi:hypothetical protein
MVPSIVPGSRLSISVCRFSYYRELEQFGFQPKYFAQSQIIKESKVPLTFNKYCKSTANCCWRPETIHPKELSRDKKWSLKFLLDLGFSTTLIISYSLELEEICINAWLSSRILFLILDHIGGGETEDVDCVTRPMKVANSQLDDVDGVWASIGREVHFWKGRHQFLYKIFWHVLNKWENWATISQNHPSLNQKSFLTYWSQNVGCKE